MPVSKFSTNSETGVAAFALAFPQRFALSGREGFRPDAMQCCEEAEPLSGEIDECGHGSPPEILEPGRA